MLFTPLQPRPHAFRGSVFQGKNIFLKPMTMPTYVYQVQRTLSNLLSPLFHKITVLIILRKLDTCKLICGYSLSLLFFNCLIS